jgi:energy-converting hydrogenase A subunit M
MVPHLVGLNLAVNKTFVIEEQAFSEDVFGYLTQNLSIDPNLQIELLEKVRVSRSTLEFLKVPRAI